MQKAKDDLFLIKFFFSGLLCAVLTSASFLQQLRTAEDYFLIPVILTTSFLFGYLAVILLFGGVQISFLILAGILEILGFNKTKNFIDRFLKVFLRTMAHFFDVLFMMIFSEPVRRKFSEYWIKYKYLPFIKQALIFLGFFTGVFVLGLIVQSYFFKV